MHQGPLTSPNSVIAAWIDCPAGLQAPHLGLGQHLDQPRVEQHSSSTRSDPTSDHQDQSSPPQNSLLQPSNQRSELELKGIEGIITPIAPPQPTHVTSQAPPPSTPHTPRDPDTNHHPHPACLAPEELLFSHYLRLVRQDLSTSTMSGPPGWTPTGMSAAFITLCPTLEPLDFLSIYKAVSNILPPVAKFNWLLVAPFVWSLRLLLLHTNILVTLLVAALGFSIMIAAEQAATAQLRREEEQGSNVIISRSRRHALEAFRPAAQPATPASPSRPPARAAAPEAAAATAHASRGMPAPAPAPSKPKEDPALQQARASVIKLESALYGNELSDGLLPADQLPVFTQKLCEEVGIAFRPGGSVAEMQQALNEVQKMVGV